MLVLVAGVNDSLSIRRPLRDDVQVCVLGHLTLVMAIPIRDEDLLPAGDGLRKTQLGFEGTGLVGEELNQIVGQLVGQSAALVLRHPIGLVQLLLLRQHIEELEVADDLAALDLHGSLDQPLGADV